MIRVWSGGAVGRTCSSSSSRARTAAMSRCVGSIARGRGGVVGVEPVGGVDRSVEVLVPPDGELGVVGAGSPAGGVGVEVLVVAPGGEVADFVVPDLRARGVGRSGPVHVVEPAGRVASEVVGQAVEIMVILFTTGPSNN